MSRQRHLVLVISTIRIVSITATRVKCIGSVDRYIVHDKSHTSLHKHHSLRMLILGSVESFAFCLSMRKHVVVPRAFPGCFERPKRWSKFSNAFSKYSRNSFYYQQQNTLKSCSTTSTIFSYNSCGLSNVFAASKVKILKRPFVILWICCAFQGNHKVRRFE